MCKSNATNTSKLRQTKQIHTQQQRQPLAEPEANTSRNREKHTQKTWEAEAGTRRNTSRNNEEHKEKTQAGTRRNPSRNKEKHKPKQGETHAKIEGSTSRSRGAH